MGDVDLEVEKPEGERQGETVDFETTVKLQSGVSLGMTQTDLEKAMENLTPEMRGVLLYVAENQRIQAAGKQALNTVLAASVVALDKACEDISGTFDRIGSAEVRTELDEVHNSLAMLMENLKGLVKPKDS